MFSSSLNCYGTYHKTDRNSGVSIISNISHVFSNAALPAWLQAFAALVALVVSVWAVFSTGAEERRRDRLRARSIAVAIYPEILKFEVLVGQMALQVEKLKSIDRALGQNVAYAVSGSQLSVPIMVERNIDNLYLLGEPAGPALLQLVNLIWQYNSLAVDISQRIVLLDANQWKLAVDQLLPRLALLTQVTKKVAEEVQPLHDSVRG